jgi:hypothetical protein
MHPFGFPGAEQTIFGTKKVQQHTQDVKTKQKRRKTAGVCEHISRPKYTHDQASQA